MRFLEVQKSELNAVIPTIGFNLSTWSLVCEYKYRLLNDRIIFPQGEIYMDKLQDTGSVVSRTLFIEL